MPPSVHPDRQAIAANQLEQLRLLLKNISGNPFYRNKLGRKGRDISSLEEFSEKIPFTRKQEIVKDQLAHPPYGSNLTFPIEHYNRFHQTSGTTGTPIRWLDTPESWQWMVESWKTIFRAAKVGRGDKVYFAFSFGPFIGFWLAFDAAQQLGCLCLPGGGLSSEARLRAIIDNQATVLCCTPTYAQHLAEVAAKNKINLRRAKVKALLVAGEPGGSIPAIRGRLQTLWPTARIFDHHGMTEVGPVTYECPKQTGVLHVMEPAYIAEIIDPDSGKPVPASETGELILTTLGRTGSPLIRYRTGDLVKHRTRNSKRGKCACGSYELALEGGILGRVDDMVIIRGVNIFPSALEDVIRGFREIVEFRVHLKQSGSLPELNVDIEPSVACKSPETLASKVQRALQTAFNLRIPVRLVSAGALPRFEMKAKRWIRS